MRYRSPAREHSQEYHHQYCPPCSRMLAWKGPTIIFPLSEDASSPVHLCNSPAFNFPFPVFCSPRSLFNQWLQKTRCRHVSCYTVRLTLLLHCLGDKDESTVQMCLEIANYQLYLGQSPGSMILRMRFMV
jgi:hypothetical protein